jgi:hypothetical protein
LGWGFVEDDDFGLERGDCQAVAVAGLLRGAEEALHGVACMSDEAEVIDIEEDVNEGHGVRVGEGEVRVVTADGVDQVGDVKSPEEGRKTTTFRESFVDANVGVVVSESVKNTVHKGVVEGAYALPEVRWDVIIMQTDEELVTGDGREG